MKVAYVFPGQGSQKQGMGRDLCEAYPAARAVFEEADAALDAPLSRLCFEGPEEDLLLTENTQPAMLAASIAAWAALRQAGPPPPPAFLAGHSLGEYSAYVAAGSLSCGDAARLVRRRGAYMQEAVPVGAGAMTAVIGMDRSDVEEACGAGEGGAWIAVDNGPGQVVIAGSREGVERTERELVARGARRTVRLDVSAPFHTPLMAPARERLRGDLERAQIADPRWPVVANVDARPRTSAREARAALVAQVTDRVQWAATLEYLHDEGVEAVVEVGPGRVLAGLARKAARDWMVLGVEDARGVEEALERLGSHSG